MSKTKTQNPSELELLQLIQDLELASFDTY